MNNTFEKLDNTIKNYPLATLLMDKELNCLSYNDEWTNISCLDTTINDSLWLNNIHPEDQKKIKSFKDSYIERVSNKIRIFNSYKQVYFWYNYYSSFDVKNQIFNLVFSPIQKEKDLIDSFSKRESRFRNIFDFAPDAIIILNNVGQVINCNRAFYKLLNIFQKFIYRY